jgi:hypothetical protein
MTQRHLQQLLALQTKAVQRLLDDLYKKAVKAALKAKQDQEEKFKKNPKLRDASPEQAARVKFLEVLRNEMKDENQRFRCRSGQSATHWPAFPGSTAQRTDPTASGCLTSDLLQGIKLSHADDRAAQTLALGCL